MLLLEVFFFFLINFFYYRLLLCESDRDCKLSFVFVFILVFAFALLRFALLYFLFILHFNCSCASVYARVDIVRTALPSEPLRLIEVELLEPHLWLCHAPHATRALAAAVHALLKPVEHVVP